MKILYKPFINILLKMYNFESLHLTLIPLCKGPTKIHRNTNLKLAASGNVYLIVVVVVAFVVLHQRRQWKFSKI